MNRINRRKFLLAIACFVIVYLLKILLLGDHRINLIDIIALVALCWIITFYIKNRFIKNHKDILIRFPVIGVIILYFMFQYFNNNFYYVHNMDIAENVGSSHNDKKTLPWNVINNFDSGRNSKVVDRTVIENDDYCYNIIPREFVNEDIIEDVSYNLGNRYNKRIDNAAYTSDYNIITSSQYRSSCDDVILEDMDINIVDKLYTTIINEKIVVLSRKKEGYNNYRLTLHDNTGTIIESYDYEMEHYESITFARFLDDEIYFAGYNMSSNMIDVMKIDKDYNLEFFRSFDRNGRVKDFAIVNDEMIVVTDRYELIKVDADGRLLNESYHFDMDTNYPTKTVNLDIGRDGMIYVARYVDTLNNKYQYKGINFIHPEKGSQYVAIDIYDNDLKRVDTIYYHQEGVGDYSLFFQVKKEGDGYKVYSHNDVVTIEPYAKNRILAINFVISSVFIFLLLVEFLTNRLMSFKIGGKKSKEISTNSTE